MTVKSRSETLRGNTLVGEVVMIAPNSVRPNDWNPNRVPPEMMAAIRYGLEHDGWYASQAMLVWATDERGRRKNIIIDAQHRWELACELKMKKVPAVMLRGVTEAQAMALTVKLGQRHGTADHDRLGDIVRDLQRASEFGADLAANLGLSDREIRALTTKPESPVQGATHTSVNSNVKMTPLFYTKEQHAEFVQLVAVLGEKFASDNITDTVSSAIRDEARR